MTSIPDLSPNELARVSIANRLYHLTAELVKWAHQVGCVVCVENPQYSLFWSATFWTSVAHLMNYPVFHSCQFGSLRLKRTMLAFNSKEFVALSLTCPGVSASHRHRRWGFDHTAQKFATATETAYPMPLARSIANAYALACVNAGVRPLPDTLHLITPDSREAMQQIRAVAGIQPRSSRIPPIAPHVF